MQNPPILGSTGPTGPRRERESLVSMVKTWKPERLEASWVPCSLPCMLKLRSKTETILRKASVSRSQVLWSPTARMRWMGRTQPRSWRCTGRSTGSCQQAVWAGLIMGIKVREMVRNHDKSLRSRIPKLVKHGDQQEKRSLQQQCFLLLGFQSLGDWHQNATSKGTWNPGGLQSWAGCEFLGGQLFFRIKKKTKK